MGTRTTQTGNRVGGHQAGRDVNVYGASVPTSLGRLIKQYKEESESDQTLNEFIQDLELFAQPIPGEPKQTLQEKLETAGRTREVNEALQLKELIYERLIQNVGSPTFQQIYAYLLALTKTYFKAYVKNLVNEGASSHEIDKAIVEKVIDPIRNELESCGESHDWNAATLHGLIYFLAGNCHVRWH